MKNTLKVIFLGVVGFAVLVYLTLPTNTVNDENKELNISYLPKYLNVIGNNSYISTDTLFRFGEERYIVVLNHDSLAVFRNLYKKINENNIILVANISNTPWLIKQIAVNGELENMYKESKISLINDSDGNFIKALGLNDNKQNRYFIYKLLSDGFIKKIYQGDVKEGTMQNGISDEEIEKSLKEIVKVFN